MDIWTVLTIIGGLSFCLLGHQLARKAAGSSEAEQSQTLSSVGEPQPCGERHIETYR